MATTLQSSRIRHRGKATRLAPRRLGPRASDFISIVTPGLAHVSSSPDIPCAAITVIEPSGGRETGRSFDRAAHYPVAGEEVSIFVCVGGRKIRDPSPLR